VGVSLEVAAELAGSGGFDADFVHPTSARAATAMNATANRTGRRSLLDT
jgi:hypothetical protein